MRDLIKDISINKRDPVLIEKLKLIFREKQDFLTEINSSLPNRDLSSKEDKVLEEIFMNFSNTIIDYFDEKKNITQKKHKDSYQKIMSYFFITFNRFNFVN